MTDTDNTQPQDDASNAELASLAVNAANALIDEKRHYEIACRELTNERAAHEEHRQQLANALGWDDPAQWPRLIRAAEQIFAGRRNWREKAEEIEADRDRLAVQVDELTVRLGEYADRGIANGQRADTAEAALTRVRTVAGRLAAHAAGFQDALDDSDRGPWGKTIGADLADLRAALGDDQPAELESDRCVCGDPIQLMDDADPTSWIHSPGSDTRCLDARPAAVVREQPAEPEPERDANTEVARHIAAAIGSYLAALTPLAAALRDALGEQQ